jgi:nucleoside 2-deoxyribosyltransferase
MLKVYIAGPMTGVENFNHTSFNEAAALWRGAGWDVVNPVELDSTTHKTYDYYLRQDIKALMDCDAIATLDGWEDSRGAKVEVTVATALGFPHFNAKYPGHYVTHPFIAGYNACCMKPKYNHEDNWMDMS